MSNHLNLQDYRILALAEALSAITHMAGSAGNESIVARETIRTSDGAILSVPFLSGNAIRHVAVREPGMHDLVQRYDLAGTLTADQQQFIYNGGANTSSGRTDDYRLVADLQHAWPLLRVVGGTLPSQVFRGSLFAGRGVLVCRENRDRIRHLVGDWVEGFDLAKLRPAEAFLSTYQYVRGSAADTEESAYGSSYQMIFSGQQVIAGAFFLIEFHLRSATLTELGALLHSLNLWRQAGSIIGGMSAKGHGRFSVLLGGVAAEDSEQAIKAYQQAVEDRRTQALEVLQRAFAKAPTRPTKTAKAATARAARKKPETVEVEHESPDLFSQGGGSGD